MLYITKYIDKLLENKDRVCICIDGRCGGGKSTLADSLSGKYNAGIIRMDHFFLPINMQTPDRVNVHYERFLEEVAPNIFKKTPFSYRVFDCSAQALSHSIQIPDTSLLIVEGSYSMLPVFEHLYDFKIFVDISSDEQKRRILLRNGQDKYNDFITRWIPREEAYFEKYNVKERCDYIFLTE